VVTLSMGCPPVPSIQIVPELPIHGEKCTIVHLHESTQFRDYLTLMELAASHRHVTTDADALGAGTRQKALNFARERNGCTGNTGSSCSRRLCSGLADKTLRDFSRKHIRPTGNDAYAIPQQFTPR